MFRRRLQQENPEVREAQEAFARTLAAVEEATSRLASAAPGGRTAGVPLAEALAGFEEAVREANEWMPGWRDLGLPDAWAACARALEESARRAERLRLGDAPEGYEALYGTLADILEPLEIFQTTAVEVRRRRFEK